MDSEKDVIIDDVQDSRSAHVLKGIYFILISIIVVSCLILITSIILKPNTSDMVSRQQIIFQETHTDNKTENNKIVENTDSTEVNTNIQ